jgi:hypothetical protein
VARVVESTRAYSFGEETWNVKSSRGKPRSRWTDNVKIIIIIIIIIIITETCLYGVE